MKLAIDWTACDGRGLCLELLPEVLRADDWGYPVVPSTSDIPADLVAPARQAVAACPHRALRSVTP